jgi:hypothetical protein
VTTAVQSWLPGVLARVARPATQQLRARD